MGKRLIDANDMEREIWNTDCDVYEFCEGRVTKMGISRVELEDAIDRVPTVDAVEVVRCKDCKHYKPQFQGAHRNCKTPYCMRCTAVKVSPDDFCSYGERKTGNNDE